MTDEQPSFPGLEPPASAEMLTSTQIAQHIADAYWEWVRDQTGRYPVAIRHPQLQKLITPFLDEGWSPSEVKHALAAMYRDRRAINRQVIEEYVDGRAARPRRDHMTITDRRAAVRYDDDGNVIFTNQPGQIEGGS